MIDENFLFPKKFTQFTPNTGTAYPKNSRGKPNLLDLPRYLT